ncbi:MAG: ATPase, T2SS/T4P/T4SS family [Planctomycetota bacterium]
MGQNGNGQTPDGAVQVVERLLATAIDRGASDLHLDPDGNGVTVSLRRDGVLETIETLDGNLAPNLVGRLKALSDLLAYRTDVPQEGRIPADRTAHGVEVRVATFPALDGERVALRFDAPDGAPAEIAELGLPADAARGLTRAVEQPEGLILLTGPSGSGKTTTLYSIVRHLARQTPRRSIVTVEDPVERRLAGVTQTEVNRPAGLDFARALRSLLRQDPDVILVGEIRDAETAAIALEAGLTGHLVASTIHAGTGRQVYARLLEMGIEPFVIATAVKGVLAQRLLRKREGGRVLAAEWAPMTEDLRRSVMERAVTDDGGEELRRAARELVSKGLTDEQEVTRVLGDI